MLSEALENLGCDRPQIEEKNPLLTIVHLFNFIFGCSLLLLLSPFYYSFIFISVGFKDKHSNWGHEQMHQHVYKLQIVVVSGVYTIDTGWTSD